MSHRILRQHIAAACCTAATNDLRYYLNGVFVDSRVVVATDGTCASAYLGPECNEYLPPFIIPLADAKRIAKDAPLTALAEKLQDGLIDIGGVVFKPIEGPYPDYRRVFVPAIESPLSAQVDPEALMKFKKIAAILKAPYRVPRLYPTGSKALALAVAIAGQEDVFMGAISPYDHKGAGVCGSWL